MRTKHKRPLPAELTVEDTCVRQWKTCLHEAGHAVAVPVFQLDLDLRPGRLRLLCHLAPASIIVAVVCEHPVAADRPDGFASSRDSPRW